MDFNVKAHDWSKNTLKVTGAAKFDCIVVGVFEAEALSGPALVMDTAAKGVISRVVKSGDMDGKSGKTVCLHEVPGLDAARVLLVGLGKRDEYNRTAYREAVSAAWQALLKIKAAQVLCTLAQVSVLESTASWRIRTAIVVLRDKMYRFTQMKSQPEKDGRSLKRVTFSVDAADEKAAKIAGKQGAAIANGMDLTRDLGNLPGNVCTPGYLANTAKTLAKNTKMKAEILGLKQIQALKMGAFLSVTRGSIEPPQFIVLHYQGAAAKVAPVVLVGKGITFDTGGISLKPGEGMDEMKYDMCGAGAVLGTLQAVAEMALKVNVIGIIPTCENMPSAQATKPGDIVTSMSGLTIEVLNTDAEGRLILCDALTYAKRLKPAVVIDIATLTGACIIALGHHNSGLFSKDDELAQALLDASREAGDAAWRLPLDDEYQTQLKSNFADLANIGGRPGGSVTAACFLSRFTDKYRWAHLDVAGTAWKSGAAKGATGRPVPLLTQFLIERAG